MLLSTNLLQLSVFFFSILCFYLDLYPLEDKNGLERQASKSFILKRTIIKEKNMTAAFYLFSLRKLLLMQGSLFLCTGSTLRI